MPDLSSAFGVPATDLTSRLRPNPRRERRERPADPAPAPAEEQADTSTTNSSAVTHPVEETQPEETAPSGRAEVSEAPARPDADRHSNAPGTSSASRRAGGTATSRRGGAGRSRGSRAAQSYESDPNSSYPVPVYLHPAVRAAAVTQRKDSKCTNAEIAFNAIDEVQHRLPGLIRDRRLQARPESSLFPGRVRRGRFAGGGAAASAGEARRVLFQFRATEAELEIIDRLVSEHGAESRSELIAVAMEESLLQGR